jgi:hypothetical protein
MSVLGSILIAQVAFHPRNHAPQHAVEKQPLECDVPR